jgi:hypothetical protein
MGSMLSIINVTKNFDGTIALDDFSLEVPRNSITEIMVPGGVGKTTEPSLANDFFVSSGAPRLSNQSPPRPVPDACLQYCFGSVPFLNTIATAFGQFCDARSPDSTSIRTFTTPSGREKSR